MAKLWKYEMISKKDEEISFEEMLDFSKQREMLSRFMPLHSYIVDWILDVICELHGNVSAYGYAARVCTAQKMVENNNPDHAMASQKTLIRVIRNLFPYDRLGGAVPGLLARCLGVSSELKRRPYRNLSDSMVKSPDLIALRYSVLVKAINGYSVSLIKVLYDALAEEEIPDYRHFADDMLMECTGEIEELKKYRNIYFFDFPETEVGTVSSYAESLHDKLRRRKEMPRDMDASYVLQQINRLQTVIRGRLQTIVLKGKKIQQVILEQRERYLSQISEFTMMISTLQTFIDTNTDWQGIENEIGKFIKDLEAKFRLEQYLPIEVLNDIRQEHSMYKQGYL